MIRIRTPGLMVSLLVFALAAQLMFVPSSAAPAADAPQGGGTTRVGVTTASDGGDGKIHLGLQADVAAAAAGAVFDVIVHARPGTDLSPYMSDLLVQHYVLPNGTQAHFGRVKAANVSKLASLPGVAAVREMRYTGDRPAIPDLGPRRLAVADDFSQARSRIAALKAQASQVTVSAAAAPQAVDDWFDVLDVHRSKAAWDLGYTGKGVKVMVNDTGTDFSHPDLQGTIARISDPGSPYSGWPEMFDSFSMLNLAYDYYLGYDFVASGAGVLGYAPDYADTRATRSGASLIDNGNSTLSASFAPIGGVEPGNLYTFRATSKSGVYHFGSHPDTVYQAVYGERAAVLVVDEFEAGVYDTVYVDLDGDFDFTAEKKAVKGDEYVYADLNGDSYADLSGGIIYWISDGINPLPASDWMWDIGADVAGPGDLVAFSINDWYESAGGDHGTLCASGVAAQGVIDGGAPEYKPAGDGTPGTGMVRGGGKDVRLTSNGDGYTTASAFTDGFIFAALGYDGRAGTEDDIQIISNSWGSSGIVNDGWDYESRLYDLIGRVLNPHLVEGNSSGNYGSGYGTVTSPGANLAISVGASTLYGSTSGTFETPAGKEQVLHGDLQSFSSSGPTAQGGTGVSVLANGAWGAGDIPLTEALFGGGADGWSAWESWGGTSRSTPVAMGNLALAMQAFREAQGVWPTNVEARALLMSGADTAHNDGFVEGAGTVNAERTVRIAAGLGGVYVVPDSAMFGDFRGERHEAFTSILHRGQVATQQFTVHNPGSSSARLVISDDHLVRLGQEEIDLTTADQSRETASFYLPDYLIDIEPYIPDEASMMEVSLVFPFGEFDPDGNYSPDSRWRVVPIDWTDTNRDGVLFTDKNGNGAVNCPIAGGLPDFANASCEIQEGEYLRFGYGYDTGTSMQQRVKLPLERLHDGIFAGISHRSRSAAVPVTHLKIVLTFYRHVDFPWLTAPASLTVPARGAATFEATMTVPASAQFGLHQATLRLRDGANQVNVPVVANVAASGATFAFGGASQFATPYDSGRVRGYFDWGSSTADGDWRFYFMDIPDDTPPGTALLVDTRWTGANTDIDTLVMSPTRDCFSNGEGCELPSQLPHFSGSEDVFGPYTLGYVGGSARLDAGTGKWTYHTATGGPHEVVAAPVTPGLNVVALHNVMFDGNDDAATFDGQVGSILATPNPVDLFVGRVTSGGFAMTVRSSLTLPALEVSGYGLGMPETKTLPQIQNDPDNPSTATYRFPIAIQDGALLEVSTAAAEGDLDLFLLYDANADGYFDFGTEVIGSSTSSSANEQVKVTFPADGEYLAAVHGWGVAADQFFDVTINAVQGKGLAATDPPARPYPPGASIGFRVNWTLDEPLPLGGEAFGLILAGTPDAPGVISIPVRLYNETPASTIHLPVIGR